MLRLGFFILLSILSVFSCEAQERIRLLSGKVIQDAKLHSVKDHSIIYQRRMTLHELKKEKIDVVETDTSLIRFSQEGEMIVEYKQADDSTAVEDVSVATEPLGDSIALDDGLEMPNASVLNKLFSGVIGAIKGIVIFYVAVGAALLVVLILYSPM
ncbi:MAG: hypothetical protein HQ500_07375 [Flavobacteriales bacterium]|nr:hypothetical protein [Flavobacteriales bacterium]